MNLQSLESIINSVKKLKPLPSNVSHIINELNKPDVSMDTLSDMISLDQVLTALILQMSNSVLLGYSRTCSTVHEAVMHIGIKRLRSVLLTSSATSLMQRSMKGYRFGAGELWQHSLAVAVASEWLAQRLHYPNSEQAYVAGLIHDIGKLLLDQAILSNYEIIAEYVTQYKMPLWVMEEKLIGIDHANLGGYIAEHWNYPIELVDAIRYHHLPPLARINIQLPAIVNLANSFTEDYQLASSGLLSFQMHPDTPSILKLKPHDIDRIKQDMSHSGVFPGLAKGN